MQNEASKRGGGIYAARGNVEIIRSSFSWHESTYDGGAIYTTVPLTITNSGFYNNNTEAEQHDGGAIYVRGSRIYVGMSNFIGNQSDEGAGGAIHLDHARGNSTISDSYFRNNTAPAPYGSIHAGLGGAISIDNHSQQTAVLMITGSRFDNNSSRYYGGAVASRSMGLIVRSSSFKDNRTGHTGGAIYRSNELPAPIGLQVENSTFFNNRANTAGNALGITHYPHTDSYRTMVNWVRNSTFVDNHDSNHPNLRDAIYVRHQSPINVYNSIFAETRYGDQECYLGGGRPYGTLAQTFSCTRWYEIGGLRADPRVGDYVEPVRDPGYFPLKADSPAIGAGVAAHCPSMDQLGNARPMPVGTRCDSGAVEYSESLLTSEQQVIDESDDTTPAPETNAPQNVYSQVKWNGIQISWNQPSNAADGYGVYRKYGDETDYAFLSVVVPAADSGTMSYFDTLNYQAGKYHYFVETIHDDSEQDTHRSTAIEVDVSTADLNTPTATATLPPPDDVPLNLRASSISTAGIQLAWDAPAAAVQGYMILRRRVDWAQLAYETIASVLAVGDAAPATTYLDNRDITGGRYVYALKSVLGDDFYSDLSDPLTLDVREEQVSTSTPTSTLTYTPSDTPTSSDTPTPTDTATATATPDYRPLNLAAVQEGNGVKLTWDAPVPTVHGYRILRRRVYLGESDFSTIFSSFSDVYFAFPTSYTDSVATAEGEYRYKVASLDGRGNVLATSAEVTLTVEPQTEQQEVAETSTNTATPTNTLTPSNTPTPTATATNVPNNWPRNVRLEIVPLRGVRIIWDPPASGTAQFYWVEKHSNGHWFSIHSRRAPNSTNSVSYLDRFAASKGTYTYRVGARHRGFGSAYKSEPVRISVPAWWFSVWTATAAADYDPRDFSASRATSGIDLSWSAPTGRINGYKVLRQRTHLNETDFSAVSTEYHDSDGLAATSYTDTEATGDGTYIYKVESIRTDGRKLGTTGSLTVIIGAVAQELADTDTPSPTATDTATATETATPSQTATATQSATASSTATVTETATATATTTDTATATEDTISGYAPWSLQATKGDNGISLTWEEPTESVTGFAVNRKRTHLGETSFTALVYFLSVGDVPHTTDFVDTSATDDGAYIYRIDSLDSNLSVVGSSDEVTVNVGPIMQSQGQAQALVNTDTPSPTATATATATDTQTPTDTATATPSPTATNDPCKLPDKIRAANSDRASGDCPAGNGHDTITLHEDIVLSEALPAITSRITINGAGFSISGDDARQIFNISWNGNLTLENITLTNGLGSFGGAIYNQGRLTIRGSTLRDNAGSLWGGALNSAYGFLTIEGSSFQDNSSLSGGAIYSGDIRARH